MGPSGFTQCNCSAKYTRPSIVSQRKLPRRYWPRSALARRTRKGQGKLAPRSGRQSIKMNGSKNPEPKTKPQTPKPATPMTLNQKQAAKEFVERWKAEEGDEIKQSRSFWIELASKVLGINDPTYVLEFERKVQGRLVDVFYEDMGILIEQKSRGVDLDKKSERSKQAGEETPTSRPNGTPTISPTPFARTGLLSPTSTSSASTILTRTTPTTTPSTTTSPSPSTSSPTNCSSSRCSRTRVLLGW